MSQTNVPVSTLIHTLPIIKLDINDIELLNFSIDDFLKEQDLNTDDDKKNKLFFKLIKPIRESYEKEIGNLELRYLEVRSSLINLYPPGIYPKPVKTYLECHLQYNELNYLKMKCALRARVFDLIHSIFHQNINIDGKASATAAETAAANENSTTYISAANINKQHTLGKRKRKFDANLDRWYAANKNQPYPMYSDKIFLAAISKISKSKVEEWMGNKRTRINNKISQIIQSTTTTTTITKVSKKK